MEITKLCNREKMEGEGNADIDRKKRYEVIGSRMVNGRQIEGGGGKGNI